MHIIFTSKGNFFRYLKKNKNNKKPPRIEVENNFFPEVFQAAPLYDMTVKLQRRQVFRKLFPGIQIILQAHSEMVQPNCSRKHKEVLGAPEHSVFTQEQTESSAPCLGAEIISISELVVGRENWRQVWALLVSHQCFLARVVPVQKLGVTLPPSLCTAHSLPCSLQGPFTPLDPDRGSMDEPQALLPNPH